MLFLFLAQDIAHRVEDNVPRPSQCPRSRFQLAGFEVTPTWPVLGDPRGHLPPGDYFYNNLITFIRPQANLNTLPSNFSGWPVPAIDPVVQGDFVADNAQKQITIISGDMETNFSKSANVYPSGEPSFTAIGKGSITITQANSTYLQFANAAGTGGAGFISTDASNNLRLETSGSNSAVVFKGLSVQTIDKATTITGTSGTAVCAQTFQGATFKTATCYLNGYANTGAAQTYNFPTGFNVAPVLQTSPPLVHVMDQAAHTPRQ